MGKFSELQIQQEREAVCPHFYDYGEPEIGAGEYCKIAASATSCSGDCTQCIYIEQVIDAYAAKNEQIKQTLEELKVQSAQMLKEFKAWVTQVKKAVG